MRLRSKLFAVSASVGLVPVVLATLLGRAAVERQARREFDQALDDGEARVRRRLRELRVQVQRAAESLADAEDQFIGRLLIAQAKGGSDDASLMQLPLTTPRVMRERGLDLLLVLNAERRVVASGHFPGQIGDRVGRRLVARDGEVRLSFARVLEKGRPVTRLTVQAWRSARSALGPRLLVMAGRYVDLEQLGLGARTRLELRDARGRRLAGVPVERGHYPERVVRLRGPAGRALATITLAVPDEPLRATLRLIDLAALGLFAGVVALALLLAWLTRLVTQPLERIAGGVAAVASGDLDQHVETRQRDEVGELAEAFNRMTAQLKESTERLQAAERVAAWRDIARGIAHELKNPLFPIQTAIETLRKVYTRKHPSFDEVFEESTVTILEEVERLKRIVGEFSGFARMPQPRLEAFDPAEWLRSTVALYHGGEVPIALELAPDLPAIVADREQLTQVLVNLLKNAQEALSGRAAPRIEVVAEHGAGALVLQVRDNGPGFAAELADKLFTPYTTSKGRSGGTGLGLSICERIVLEHGGTIEARGAPGGGAVFVVRLPHQPSTGLMGPRARP